MAERRFIKLIAFIEVAIGLSTIAGLISYEAFSISKKPLNVFLFVLISAIISTMIGFGLFNHKEWARRFLVFFSGYIIITKIMVFFGLLHFTGEIITFIPASFKNYISILYHGLVMIFMTRRSVKDIIR